MSTSLAATVDGSVMNAAGRVQPFCSCMARPRTTVAGPPSFRAWFRISQCMLWIGAAVARAAIRLEYDFLREAEDIVSVMEAIGEPVFALAIRTAESVVWRPLCSSNQFPSSCCTSRPIPTGLSFDPPGLIDRMQALIGGAARSGARVVHPRGSEDAGSRAGGVSPVAGLADTHPPCTDGSQRGRGNCCLRFEAGRFATCDTIAAIDGRRQPQIFHSATATLKTPRCRTAGSR